MKTFDPWRPIVVIALAAILGLAFLGTRGLFDPDEGRYTNVALHMLDSGDWVTPRRYDDVGHFTKPPVTYWAIASSVAVFGRNPWAARLPMALAYLGCVFLAWRIARRLAPAAQIQTAVAYATLLMPFAASQLVTTDFLLAFLQTSAMACFVEARFGPAARARWWIWLLWLALGVAFMTKGPPALLPLLAMIAFDALVARPERRTLWSPIGIGVFVLVALPWFLVMTRENPGLLEYFLRHEVYHRIATDRFGRHGEWYGWLEIYLPTLVIGTLPWTRALWRGLRANLASWRAWRAASARQADATILLPLLWIALPLLVFCVARSRLPLYLLPLFVPLALIIGRAWRDGVARAPGAIFLGAWALALIALKLAVAYWPTSQNAVDWVAAIRERVDFEPREILFVEDQPRYALHLYLHAEIEKIALDPTTTNRFNPDYDEPLDEEIADEDGHALFITKTSKWPAVRARIEQAGFAITTHGEPFRDRVMFTIKPEGVIPATPREED